MALMGSGSWIGSTGSSIGGTVTGGTTGSILFVGSGPVLAQDNANFFWDDTNNRLGINTSSPVSAISVADVNPSGTFTRIVQSGSFVAGGLNSLTTLNAAGNSNNSFANYFAVSLNHSSNHTGVTLQGFETAIAAGNTSTYSTLRAANNIAMTFGSGAVSTIEGMLLSAQCGTGSTAAVTTLRSASLTLTTQAANVITTATNMRGLLTNAGTITTYYGFLLSNPSNSGTITNTYGFYCGDITTGTQTNTPFSFYAEDANALVYFAGKVGINQTAPTSMLDVVPTSASVVGQIIKAAASQTANLLNIQDSSATNLIAVSSGGNVTTANSVIGWSQDTFQTTIRRLIVSETFSFSTFNFTTSGSNSFVDTISNYGLVLGQNGAVAITIVGAGVGATAGQVGINASTPGAQFAVTSSNAGFIGSIIKGASAQSANLTEWQNSSATVLSKVESTGHFVGPSFGNVTNADPATYGFVFNATSTYRFDTLVNSTGASSEPQYLLRRQRSGSYAVTAGDRMGAITWNTMSFLYGEATASTTGGFSTIDMCFRSTNAAGTAAERFRISAEGLVGINNTAATAQLHIINATAANNAITVKAAASQAGHMTEWQNSSGTSMAHINSSGALFCQGIRANAFNDFSNGISILVYDGGTVNSFYDGGGVVNLRLIGGTGVVHNDSGTSTLDFRMEGDTADHLFFMDASADKIGLNQSAPVARVHLTESTLGNEVFRLESTATNTDPAEKFFQNRVATTDNTPTTIHTVAIPATTTKYIEAKIVARRTGGVLGTAEDGGAFEISGAFKNVAGTATQIGATQAGLAVSDSGTMAVAFTTSSGNVLIEVTGDITVDYTFHAHIRTYEVSS